MLRSVMQGVGSCLPERVLTNHDLAKLVDTSDEWIVERSGIHGRRALLHSDHTRPPRGLAPWLPLGDGLFRHQQNGAGCRAVGNLYE